MQCNRSSLMSDSDSYRSKRPVVSSPPHFEVSAASPVEHSASSTMGGVFRKVRLIFPSMSTIFEQFDGVRRGGSDESQPTVDPPSPTFSSSSLPSSSLPSSPGPATPPPFEIDSPYHTVPLPTSLNTVLATSQTPFWNWNMLYPRETITPRTNLPSDIWTQAATQPAVGSMDIFYKHLPWRITVYSRLRDSYVTVADVLDGLYHALSKPVTAAEFELLPTADKKHAVKDTYFRRCNKQSTYALQISEQRSGIKRVDFLGGRSKFEGLTYSKEGWNLVLS